MQAGAPENEAECTYVVGVGLVPQVAAASEILSQLYSEEILEIVAERVTAYGSAFERALAAAKVIQLVLDAEEQHFASVRTCESLTTTSERGLLPFVSVAVDCRA